MAVLTAKINGKDCGRLELEAGRKYVVGRSSDCDLILADAVGISRYHFELTQKDGVWSAHGLSRFIPLSQNGEAMETVELNDGCIFFAEPFEFQFETDSAPMINPAPVFTIVRNARLEKTPLPSFVKSEAPVDATELGNVVRKPCVKIRYLERNETELIQLEGNHWTAGRDSVSEITIRDNRASRSHFELFRMRDNFFLVDLGSANGTMLNGKRAPEHEPVKLESGDVIAISGVEFLFEIRDTSSGIWGPAPHTIARDQALFPKSASPLKNRSRSFLFGPEARMLAIVFIVAVGSFAFHFWKIRGVEIVIDHSLDQAKLSPEEKVLVKDTFTKAQGLYVSNKYDDCIVELNKLHLLVPQYEYSKDLQSLCEQGKELIVNKNDVVKINQKTEQMNRDVAKVIERCKSQLTLNSSVAETRACLAPALAINPANPAIGDLLRLTESRVEELKIAEARDKEARTRNYICHSGVKRAKSLTEKDKLSLAIQAYESVMDNRCEDATQARREIASIKEKLNAKVNRFLKQCDDLGKKSQFKDAYKACDKALTEDPSNEIAKTRAAQMALELKHQVKAIYDDSVLDESMGNVDSAVEKWKRILKEDLDFDDYAMKAKVQLEKYGANSKNDEKKTARLNGNTPDGI